jgi:hypothetical protein
MRLLPLDDAPLSILGRFVAYPIGKITLRILTLGRYPPEDEKHNALFVALPSWWFFTVVAVAINSLHG